MAGGVFFLLLAIVSIGLAALVSVLYVFKQNSLQWILTAILLSIIGLVFLVISIKFFRPTSQTAHHSGMKHCPGCGCKLHQEYSMISFCPNPQCNKKFGPEDINAKFCTSCGTDIKETISQMTGQLPTI
jgi:hypothetical protein